jgi:hypothetical protein
MEPQANTSGGTNNAFGVNSFDPNADQALDTSLDDVTTDDTTTAGDDTTQVDAAEVQAQEEAKQHGWVPKEEWRGPSERWRPASEFLEVRTRIAEIAREENQQLRARLAAQEAKLAERDRREAEDRTKIERETLKLELRNAREQQDWDKVDEITDRMFDLKVATAAAPKAPAVDPHAKEIFDQFSKSNPWLEKDPELRANFIMELKGVSGITNDPAFGMKIAKDRVMRLYPEKFRSNGARPRTSMTEMGGNPGGGTNGKTWADLTPSYRAAAESDMKRLGKNSYTKEEFLANCAGDPDAFRR